MPKSSRIPSPYNAQEEQLLADTIANFYDDPLGFVLFVFPWGEKGSELEDEEGPDIWQAMQLMRIHDAIAADPEGYRIQDAIASGHGIGKSCEVSWIILWAISTRPHLAAVITANTDSQLRTKTWKEVAKWHKLSRNSHWFEWTATRLSHVEHPETWYAVAIPNSEHNSEAFAGTHATHVLLIFDEACHDDRTQVMSDRGWLYFKDVTPDDNLLTMDTSTRQAYFDKPTHLHASHRVGSMIEYSARGCNFSVTPNHNMLYYSSKLPDTPRLAEAQSLNWSNKSFPKVVYLDQPRVETFHVPAHIGPRVDYPARDIPMDNWLSLLGWFITDGTCQVTEAGRAATVSISQTKEPHRETLRQLLIDSPFDFKEYNTHSPVFCIHDAALCNLLMRYKYKGHCRVPEWVFKLSADQINLFLDGAVGGDGYTKGGREIIYTSSPELAGDYHALILLTGDTSTDGVRKMEGVRSTLKSGRVITSTKNGHVVSRSQSHSAIHFREKPSEVDYDGMVYCATISGGVLYTRREGHAMWSGNSAIPGVIWQVAEGAMTTPRSMWFVYGNPTQSTGSFRECYGKAKHRWNHHQVDSRTCRKTDKNKIEEWKEDWGEDSDFFRVRVRGVFPRSGTTQLIGTEEVENARLRTLDISDYMFFPVVVSVDVARFGEDETVITIRQGRKLHRQDVYRSLRNTQVASKAAHTWREFKKHGSSMGPIMVDGIGLGAGVVDALFQSGYPVTDVNVGASADEKELFYNKRAECFARMKEWFDSGADIINDPELIEQATNINYDFDNKERIRIEKKDDMKARGLSSPDRADSLALSFAEFVEPVGMGNSAGGGASFEPDWEN